MSNVNNNALTAEQLSSMSKEEIIRLFQAREASKGSIIKVSPKGGVSLYGLGQYPVTLYRTQWEYLFAHVDEVKAFIQANAPLLAVKPVKPTKADATKAA